MRQCIFAVASFWYTAWANAGQPELQPLVNSSLPETDKRDFEELDRIWKTTDPKDRTCGNWCIFVALNECKVQYELGLSIFQFLIKRKNTTIFMEYTFMRFFFKYIKL